MEQQKNIETIIRGLKCDNPNCDWEDDTVSFEDYPKWLNARCPKCGQNVLTEQDLENAQLAIGIADFINTLSPEEIKAIGGNPDVEGLKEHPLFKNTIGLDLLKTETGEGYLTMVVDTHDELKVTEIKKTED
jgi:hypothetical protein